MARTFYRIAATLALALTLTNAVHAQADTPSIPEVHCTAVIDRTVDDLVQVDCYGPVMAEAYERLVPVSAVNAALAPILAEYTFDLVWEVR